MKHQGQAGLLLPATLLPSADPHTWGLLLLLLFNRCRRLRRCAASQA